MATKAEWAQLFGMLEVMFGKQETARHAMYAERLADAPFSDVCAAVSKCIDECKFYPTIADIRERMPAQEDPKAKGLQAWQRVLQAACSEIYVEHNPHTGTWPTGERLSDVELECCGGSRGLARIRDMYYSDGNGPQLGYEKMDFLARYENETRPDARPLLAWKGRDVGRLTSGGSQPLRIGAAMGAKDE